MLSLTSALLGARGAAHQTRLRADVLFTFPSMPDPVPPATRPEPRRSVLLDDLRTDISLCLQLLAGRVVREAASREAFGVVAGAIVDEFKRRGYEITAPPPARPHSAVSHPNWKPSLPLKD